MCFKLKAKNNFGIEKTSYFGNFMDPIMCPIVGHPKRLKNFKMP